MRATYPRTILSIAYPLFPVSCASGGGAEQILSLLDHGLVRAGYRSLVLSTKGSRVTGELIEAPAAQGTITDSIREEAHGVYRKLIENTLQRHRVDLIHFHGLDFHSYRPDGSRIPQLATLHLPIAWYPERIFNQPCLTLNCVSRHQAESAPFTDPLPFVNNGIATECFYLSPRKQNYLLWLGRICPEKGVHIALRVARRLNLSIAIAGPVHPLQAHEEYFAREVEPLLDDKRRYLGAVNREQKAQLLASARCLLIPSLVQETSSLVAMEACSSGTPVIAFASGALRK